MCLQSPCWYPCCVCLSTALVSSAYTSRTHLPYDCHLSLFRSSGPACVMQKLRVPFHLDVIARLLTDLETRRCGIFIFHSNDDIERWDQSDLQALSGVSFQFALGAVINGWCSVHHTACKLLIVSAVGNLKHNTQKFAVQRHIFSGTAVAGGVCNEDF